MVQKKRKFREIEDFRLEFDIPKNKTFINACR